MSEAIVTRDIFLRHTAPSGSSYCACHRVWDAERFVASQQKAAADTNERQKDDAPRKAKVEQITEAQYLADRARGKA